jgi:hypothetical protein
VESSGLGAAWLGNRMHRGRRSWHLSLLAQTCRRICNTTCMVHTRSDPSKSHRIGTNNQRGRCGALAAQPGGNLQRLLPRGRHHVASGVVVRVRQVLGKCRWYNLALQ